LSGHRLDIKPARFLRIGINEALLFGGRDQSYSLFLINPVIFFHGEQMNGPDGGNTIGSIDATWMPRADVTVYGNLMIDDFQLEKSGPGDLEPDQIGWLVGANWADPFDWTGTDWFGEYTRVTNRTYNGQGGAWEKWLHRRQPIGHFLGNDFDRVLVGMRCWPKPQWFWSLTYEHRRRGEGRIENPFDTPWMDVPIGENYHEPFPFGVVESTNRIDCELNWMPFWGIRTRLALYWIDGKNIENTSNVSRSDRGGFLELSFDLLNSIRLR
ncbi:hypothetical protein JW992_10755, partial [candidate division KSB1 bacterium]|nr:hypothetical protein [candidate division KSB1 bacterium]